MSETVAIDDVQYIEDLYPRIEVDDQTVRRYQNAIDQLPPIEVSEDLKLIDGYHRLRAHRQEGRSKIEAEITQVEDDDELFRLAVEANADHGLQLSKQEKKQIAREWKRSNGGITNKQISDVLSVSDSTMSNWVRDVAEEKREERRDTSLKLYLDYLAYPDQRAVAKELDVGKGTVQNDLDKKSISGEIVQQFDFIKVDNVWRFQHPERKGENDHMGVAGANPECMDKSLPKKNAAGGYSTLKPSPPASSSESSSLIVSSADCTLSGSRPVSPATCATDRDSPLLHSVLTCSRTCWVAVPPSVAVCRLLWPSAVA
jgi:transposase